MSSFGTFDYAVFTCFLCASVGIGIYHAQRSKTVVSKRKKAGNANVGGTKTSEYLMGGRQMPILPICLSLMTTFMSGISLLGAPGEIYQRGFLMFVMYLCGGTVLLANGLFFLPVFYKLKATSAFEYLEKRFHSVFLRKLGAFLFLLNTLIYMAIVMFAPAQALTGVTKASLVPFILAVGISSTVYTSIGGLKAVVWTDTFQAFFMYLGLGILLVKGTSDAGGITHVLNVSQISGRIDAIWRFDVNPAQYNSLWIAIFGSMAWYLILFCLNPMALQRFCSMRSLRHARIVNYLTIPALGILGIMCCYIGVVMLAFFFDCDPIASGKLTSKDQLAILFAIDVLGFLPGLPGLFLACIFSGTLSTISSGINSMSAIVWEDFLKERYADKLTDNNTVLLTKVLASCFGLTATALAFSCQYYEGLVQASYSTTGALSGPLYGLFVLGVFVPHANKCGAFIALVISTLFLVTCSVGNNLTKPYNDYTLPTQGHCNANSNSSFAVDYRTALIEMDHLHYGDTSIFYLFRVSSFSYSLFGLLLVLLIGSLASWSLNFSAPLTSYQKRLAHSLTYSGRHDPLPKSTVLMETEVKMNEIEA